MAVPITRELFSLPQDEYIPLIAERTYEIGEQLYGVDTEEAKDFGHHMLEVTSDYVDLKVERDIDFMKDSEDDQIEDLLLGMGVKRSLIMAKQRRDWLSNSKPCVVDHSQDVISG